MELEFEKPIVVLEKELEKLRHREEQGKDKGKHQKIADMEKRLADTIGEVYGALTPWQTVQVARHPKRPVLRDYLTMIFSDFIELHGDRCFGDDPAMIGGFAKIGDRKVMVIGHNKGKNVEENIKNNFGMASPEGYRKALRLMRLAEKYGLPIITFIDTAGAFPGLSGEERGQHEAIARNLTEMARIKVPVIVIVTGEGGSGGALGIGVGDVLLMLSNATYSVISPEGCAGILWRDGTFAPQAAEAMKLTAASLLELGVIDEIIPEAPGGAHRDPAKTAEAVKTSILAHLKALSSFTGAKLCSKRFEKFSAMGKFLE